MATVMTRLLALIAETVRWRAFHKARGASGQIETLCANIRLKALTDALAAIEDKS
jgi:hypothetical protein